MRVKDYSVTETPVTVYRVTSKTDAKIYWISVSGGYAKSQGRLYNELGVKKRETVTESQFSCHPQWTSFGYETKIYRNGNVIVATPRSNSGVKVERTDLA